MENLQLPAHLILEVTKQNDWENDLIITPIAASIKNSPDKPGETLGDTLFVAGEKNQLLVSLGKAEKIEISK